MGLVLNIQRTLTCSVTIIAPISTAKGEPTYLATILAVKIGANSPQKAKAKAPPTVTVPNISVRKFVSQCSQGFESNTCRIWFNEKVSATLDISR